MTFIATALAFAKRLPWQVYAAIAVLALLALTYRAGWNARDEKADRERAEYIAQYEQAADRARRAQQAVMDREKARYDALAKEADENAQDAQSAAMDAARRYVAANRVRPRGSVPSGPGAAPDSDSAQGSDGPGGSAIVDAVAVSEDDIRICTTNTVRLQSVREWAEGLAENP